MLNFSHEKEMILNKLREIQAVFDEIKETIGMNESLYDDINQKILTGIEKVKDEKFHISFFGAFSDGKSSILSAITKSLDIPIAPEPTTDKVEVYEHGDYFLVDTPGLFAKDLTIHDEKTKRYISEADVIIYVVDAINPIKESHLQTIKWLMKDLNKIDATVIVINKMDTTGVELEDNQSFQKVCKIKKDEVKKILHGELGIEKFDRIVCISADPYQLGLKEWFEREQEYRRLSRIEELQKTIDIFIKNAKERLQKESGLSIIRDIIIKLNGEIKGKKDERNIELDTLIGQSNELRNALETFEKDIRRASKNIFDELVNLKKELTTRITICTNMSELNSIILNEFGQDGYIFRRRVEDIFKTHLERLAENKRDALIKFENTFAYYSEFANEFLKNGLGLGTKLLSQINSSTILKTRDFLKISYKFKPWGAVKWAKWANRIGAILAGLIVVIDIIENYKFKQRSNEILKDIEDIFKELLEESEEDKIREQIGYSEMKDIKENLENNIRELGETIRKIDEYKKRLEVVSI
jgi:GTP-binding protein EngB required for normal cell division